MTDSGITVHEAWSPHAASDVRGTVLMLPGRRYDCTMSLLAWTTRALQADGWRVLQAVWSIEELADDPVEFVERAAGHLDAADRADGPVIVVAKSLGTHAAHWAAERRYPAVWLTPVLTHETLAERLRTYPAPSLTVGGTADDLWRTGFRTTGEVLEIPGGDHLLEVADWRTSLRNHEQAAAAAATFAGHLSP